MKRILSLALMLGLTASFTLASSMSAQASDPVSEAVQALESTNVVGGNATLKEAYEGSNVGVVNFNSMLLQDIPNGQNLTTLANTVLQNSDGHYSMIVVNTDNGAFGVAGKNSETIIEILSKDTGANTSEKLVTFSDKIITASTENVTSTQTSAPPAFLSPAVTVPSISLLVVLLAAAGFMYFKNKRKPNTAKLRAVTSAQIDDRELEKELEALVGLSKLHAAGRYPTTILIKSVVTNLNTLFDRLERTGAISKKGLVSVKYQDILGKINKALGVDYYLNIKENESYWDRPAERISEVEAALANVDKQIIENIKQVNSSRDLDFRLGLESLIDDINNDHRQILGG